MKIAILNYTGNRGNWGSQATSQLLLQELREIFGAETTFHLVPLLKSGWRDRVAEALHLRSIREELAGGKPGKAVRRATEWLYGEYVEGLRSADLVIFQSEGTMEGVKFTTGERLLLLPAYSAGILGKPVWALNGSIDTLAPSFERLILGTYGLFEVVTAREPNSVDQLVKMGLKSELFVDSAFECRPVKPSLALPDRYVCITGSACIRSWDWLPLYQAIEQELDGTPLVYLLSGPGDLKTLGETVAKNGIVVPKDTPYGDVCGILEGADCLIGGRYHMQILSACAGTPFLPLPSGSQKTDGLLRLLG